MTEARPRTLFEYLVGAAVDDDVLAALSVAKRRYVCYHLLDEGQVTLADLADAVADWMTAAHVGPAKRVDRDQLRTALYHTHVPVLAEAGLVEVGEDWQVVEPTLSDAERELIEVTHLAEHWTDDAVE